MKKCTSCDSLIINGIFVHEEGCPDSWITEIRECKWCGFEFIPETEEQQFCCSDCGESYFV